MANKENLIPLNKRSKSVQRAIQQKGREANKRKWREKLTVRAAVEEILNSSVDKYPTVRKIAGKLGLEENASIKEFVTLSMLMNGAAKGGVQDLERLANLLGESDFDEDVSSAEKILTSIRECAYDENRDKPETS